MKRNLFIFVVAMLLSVAGASTPINIPGSSLYWELTGSGSNLTLTISGTGAMPNFSYNSRPWEDNIGDIRYLSIGSGVTTIGNYAFFNGSSITGPLTISNAVTIIGEHAFQNCSSITGLTIGNNVSTIGSYAFSGCSGITGQLIIPNLVTTIESSTFSGCSKITGTLTVPDLVNTIGGYAFRDCSGIEKLTIGNSVKTIDYDAFSGCSGITGTLTIPNLVTSIGSSAFFGCSGITGTLIIPNLVTSIGSSAFSGCSSLETVNFNATNCTNMGNSSYFSVFKGCTFTTLNIGENVKIIPNYAFYDCSSITGTLTIPGAVTSIGNEAFRYCSSLNAVNFNATDCTTMGSQYFYVFSGCTAFTTLNIGNNVTRIPDYAFSGCSSITGTLTIPDAVTSIGSQAFMDCSITKLTIGNNVKTIGSWAFSGCSSITGTLTIPDAVNSIGIGAFNDCSSITGTLTIPNAITTIEVRTFEDCGSITGLTIGNAVTTIGWGAFKNCSNITGPLTIPDLVIEIGGNLASGAFYNCSSITELTIGNAVTTIGWSAFENCSGITGTLTIPSSVKTIESWAFANCSNVNTVNFNATHCTTMGSASTVFDGCTAFTTLNIGNNVTNLPDDAFYKCSSIKSITSFPTVPPTVYFYTFSYVSKSIPVYVPCASLNAYKSAPYWSDFTNYIAIEAPSQPGDITGSTTVCAEGDAQTYSISAVPGATSYTWTLSGGWNINSGQGTPVIVVTPTSSGSTISVTADNACGSGLARTLAVTVNPILVPSVTISTNDATTVCDGTSISFTATQTNGGTSPSYQWKVDGVNVGANSATYTYDNPVNSAVVTCEMTSNAACATPTMATSNEITVTVNPILVPSVTIAASDDATVCDGTAIIFTATQTNGGTSPSYQWKVGGVNVGINSETYTYDNPVNNAKVTCEMGSNATCANPTMVISNEITVTVNPVLVPSVTIAANGSTTVCDGTPIIFYATQTNGGTNPNYQWKVNGFNVGSNATTYNYTDPENDAVVTCEMTSNATCATPETATSNEIMVTVNTPPTAPTGIDGTNVIEAGESTTLTASGGDEGSGCIYQWGTESCGNNIVSGQTEISITVSPTTTTTYWVRRVGDSPCNGTTNCATITVTVYTNPDPKVLGITISPKIATVQLGGTQQFTATVFVEGGADESVTWDVSGNLSSSTTVSNNGLLTVGSNEIAETIIVRTTSVFDPTFSDEATVTIYTGTEPKVLGVTISPKTATVQPGETQPFTATVNAVGGADESVTWSVSGNLSTATTVSTAGLLTIGNDETAEIIIVKVASVFAPTVYDEAVVTVTSVGIAETDNDSSLRIYPNPVQNLLTIESEDANLAAEYVKIYDMLGKEVLERKLSDGKVDVSQLPPGTYILKTGAYIGKFVKE